MAGPFDETGWTVKRPTYRTVFHGAHDAHMVAGQGVAVAVAVRVPGGPSEPTVGNCIGKPIRGALRWRYRLMGHVLLAGGGRGSSD